MFPDMELRQTAHVSTSASAISALAGEGHTWSTGHQETAVNVDGSAQKKKTTDDSSIAKNIAATAYHGLEPSSTGTAGSAIRSVMVLYVVMTCLSPVLFKFSLT